MEYVSQLISIFVGAQYFVYAKIKTWQKL